MADWISILAGVFGGSGAVLLWELGLRPWIQGRAVAEVLSAEVSLNLEYLAAMQMLAKPNKVPSDFSLGTAVFASLVDRIGDLPPNLVGEVVFLYRYFDELNRTPARFADTLQEFRRYEPSMANHAICQRELSGIVAVFNQTVVKTISRIELVQPLLLRAASPWWSFRGRRRRKAISLNTDTLRRKFEKSLADRQALAQQIEAREQPNGSTR